MKLEGVYSVLPTPFAPNGDLDLESLKRVIDLFVGAGVNGLVAVYPWRSPDDGTAVVRFTFAADALAHEAERPLDQGIVRALWLTQAEVESGRHALRTIVRAGAASVH